MVHFRKHIIGMILLVFVLTDCSVDSKKQSHNNTNLITSSYSDSLWIKFRDAMQVGNIDYLIENSQDSIKCVDCVIDSASSTDIYESKIIFNQYLSELNHLDTLSNYEFLSEKTDSMIYINYMIKSKYAEEGAYNLIFMFKQVDSKFLFSGMITTP